MRLAMRLLLSLIAAAVVAGSLLFVVFVFWDQTHEQNRRQLLVEKLKLDVELALHRDTDVGLWLRTLEIPAAVSVGLVGDDTSWVGTGERLAPENCMAAHWETTAEYENFVSPVVGSVLWSCVVISWKHTVMFEAMYGRWLRGLGWLVAGLGAFVGLGFLFSRHAVSRPIARLTELVRAGDPGGLSSFGEMEPNELSHLSRSIIGMSQRIGDDRAQLATQLVNLQSAHDDLKHAQEQLVRAERLAVVGQLAAGVAHEVGNPLSIMGGYIDMLKAGDLGEADADKALESVSREIDRINRTIRELLDFSRGSPGTEGDEVGELLVALSHVRELLRPQALFRDIELQMPSEVDLQGAVPVATDRLVQLLLNLLLNAGEAMEGRGQIHVGIEAEAGFVRVTIDDSGPGVDPELQARLFEPFFTTRPAGEGTGLGLAVCEQIVNSGGGTIECVPSSLGGAAFVIRFKLLGLAEA